MSEKLSQSNSEKPQMTLLVPRSNGEIQPATLTGKVAYNLVRQRDGSNATIKAIEVQFPNIIGDDGKVYEQKKMVSEHLLGDDVQENLATQLHDGLYNPQPSPEAVSEHNEYDALFADNYDADSYSIDAAGERSSSPEVHSQEMLEYADAVLSRAMRTDADLQHVIVNAFSQVDMPLPNEKEALIKSMGSDERIRGQIRQYLRAKAEYYRSDLPERVQQNTNKRPNYPGSEPQPSLDVATEYAVRMITGEWDQSREDGEVETNAAGDVIRGQHRDAAHTILMSPRIIRKE